MVNYLRDERILNSCSKLVFTYPDVKVNVDVVFVSTNGSSHSGGATSYSRLIEHYTKLGFTTAVVNANTGQVKISTGQSTFNRSIYDVHVVSPVTVVDFWTSSRFFEYNPEANKILFVQDRDYYFYAVGDCSSTVSKLLQDPKIKKITLGDWIPDSSAMKNVCSIPFPTPESLMKASIKDVSDRISLIDFDDESHIISVFFKLEQKRLPYYLLDNLIELKKNNPNFEIRVFGDSNLYLKMKYSEFTWLGFLPYEKMMDCLSESTIGIVCSVSNISLLPFEMMASGLITIQNDTEVVSHFFGEEAFVFDPVNGDLAALVESIKSLNSSEITNKIESQINFSRDKVATWDVISERFSVEVVNF